MYQAPELELHLSADKPNPEVLGLTRVWGPFQLLTVLWGFRV